MKFSAILALALGAEIHAGTAGAQMAMTGAPPIADSAGTMPHQMQDGLGEGMGEGMGKGMGHGMRPGPVGIIGRHVLPRGKFMLSYRIGTTDIDPASIATPSPTAFSGCPASRRRCAWCRPRCA